MQETPRNRAKGGLVATIPQDHSRNFRPEKKTEAPSEQAAELQTRLLRVHSNLDGSV